MTACRMSAPLLAVEREHLERGLALFERVEGLGAFDAVLAAAAIVAGATTLVSVDSGFADVPGLPHMPPDAAGVAALTGDQSEYSDIGIREM